MSTPPDLKGALEAMKAASRGPRRRSPVYDWLAVRYDGLTAAFRTSQPSWKALADYLGKGGVMGADGVPATPAAVRSAWLRVQADKARRRPQTAHYSSDAIPSVPSAVWVENADTTDGPDFDFGSFIKERP